MVVVLGSTDLAKLLLCYLDLKLSWTVSELFVELNCLLRLFGRLHPLGR